MLAGGSPLLRRLLARLEPGEPLLLDSGGGVAGELARLGDVLAFLSGRAALASGDAAGRVRHDREFLAEAAAGGGEWRPDLIRAADFLDVKGLTAVLHRPGPPDNRWARDWGIIDLT